MKRSILTIFGALIIGLASIYYLVESQKGNYGMETVSQMETVSHKLMNDQIENHESILRVEEEIPTNEEPSIFIEEDPLMIDSNFTKQQHLRVDLYN